jgi:hypothetical protein
MLAPGKYYINTEIRLTASFVDSAGDAVDPDTVTFKTYSPSGQIASYVFGTDSAVQKASTGNYTADITPDKAGRWFYRWETTGTGTVLALEGNLIVQASPFFDCADTGYAFP